MNFDFDFPEISDGFYKIMSFSHALKSHELEINTAIEFAHIIKVGEGNSKTEKIQSYHYRQFNIECLIFLKMGDQFNDKSVKLKKNSKSLKIKIPSYENIEFENYDHLIHGFNISERSNGFKFYLFKRQYGDRQPIKIILPSIVIGQAFWLNNSLIVRNLFRNSFDELNELISVKESVENDRVVGNILLKKPVDEAVKAMIQSMSFFLFSKNNFLKKKLKKTQSDLYLQFLRNPNKIDYNFTIPLKQELIIDISGRYFNKDNQTYFIAEEIIGLDPKNDFNDLYTVDEIRFYDYGKEATGIEDLNSNRKRIQNIRKNKNSTVTNEGKNPNLAKNFVESGIDLLSQIVKLSIDYKTSSNSKSGKTITKPASEFGTFNTKIPDSLSNSSELIGSKKNVDNENKNSNKKAELFLLLREIIKKLQSKFSTEEVMIDNDDFIIFNVSKDGRNVLLVDDILHKRIQILYKVNLTNFDKTEIKNLVKLVVDNNYNWGKLKSDSKKSEGIKLDETMIKIGISTNYNIEGNRAVKNVQSIIGSQNIFNEADLCYQNIIKKLENLFL